MIRSPSIIAAGAALFLAACQQAPAETPPLAEGSWTLDDEASRLSYVSIKSGEIAENNYFTELSGSVSPDGEATIEIDLDSLETGVDIRDERMREVFFNIADFPTATITAQVDPEAFEDLDIGERIVQPLKGTLSVKGVETGVDTEIAVTRIAADRVQVASTDPVIVMADSLDLTEGLAHLQELAGLPSITPAVPVTFSLTFESE